MLLVAVPALILLGAILSRARYLRSISPIPGPPFSFWLGSTSALRGSPSFYTQRHLALRKLHADYGPAVKLVLPFGRGALILHARASDVEPAFKDTTAFPSRPNRSSIIPRGLLALPTDGTWRAHRTALLPALSTGALRRYLPVIVAQAEHLCDHLASSPEADVDVHKPLTAATLMVISQIGFGLPMGALRDVLASPLMEYGSAILEGQVAMLAAPSPLVRLLRALPRRLMPMSQKRMLEGLDEYTAQAAALYRTAAVSKAARPAGEPASLLEALADARLPFAEARDEIISLLIAGHETTANTLSWVLLLLAAHPRAQAAAREEVEAALARRGAQELCMDDLPQLVYTRAVFLEALRLYPTVPMVARVCAESARVGAHVIPAGSTLGYSIACAARDPASFDAPDAFEPGRFLGSAGAAAWHPFGPEGPRKCLGFRLADAEALAFLATVLRRFEVEPASSLAEPPREYTDATLGPKQSGLRVRLRPLAPALPASGAA